MEDCQRISKVLKKHDDIVAGGRKGVVSICQETKGEDFGLACRRIISFSAIVWENTR